MDVRNLPFRQRTASSQASPSDTGQAGPIRSACPAFRPAAAESASLLWRKSVRSTEFPLRRLAVRGCERTMSGAKRRAPMRSSGDRISGAAECQGDCGAIEPTKPPTGMKWRLSIFEVALAIASAERNLRSGFPYCGYQESRHAGSIGLCGGSYCRRSSPPTAAKQQIANQLKQRSATSSQIAKLAER